MVAAGGYEVKRGADRSGKKKPARCRRNGLAPGTQPSKRGGRRTLCTRQPKTVPAGEAPKTVAFLKRLAL